MVLSPVRSGTPPVVSVVLSSPAIRMYDEVLKGKICWFELNARAQDLGTVIKISN